jgi:glycine cleavage system H protein
MAPELRHLPYQRSRFRTRLPLGRLYTRAHQWLEDDGEGGWRVGYTKFALRMLGDPVEFDFEVDVGAEVDEGQAVGWLEGFKAVTDVFTPLSGRFGGPNPQLAQEIELLSSSPYERGWLFRVSGPANEACVDAEGYAAFLDTTIDRMTGDEPGGAGS